LTDSRRFPRAHSCADVRFDSVAPQARRARDAAWVDAKRLDSIASRIHTRHVPAANGKAVRLSKRTRPKRANARANSRSAGVRIGVSLLNLWIFPNEKKSARTCAICGYVRTKGNLRESAQSADVRTKGNLRESAQSADIRTKRNLRESAKSAVDPTQKKSA
jgi:hypothetical protein